MTVIVFGDPIVPGAVIVMVPCDTPMGKPLVVPLTTSVANCPAASVPEVGATLN